MNETLTNILMKLEPLYGLENFKKPGELVRTDLEIKLSSTRLLKLEELLLNAPVLLVFIKGTWCPFCRLHLSRMRSWNEKLKNQSSIIVVSSETIEQINQWLKNNPVNYLFASDENSTLGKEFGVWVESMDFNQASTFLIDKGGVIRTAFVNRRDENLNIQTFEIK